MIKGSKISSAFFNNPMYNNNIIQLNGNASTIINKESYYELIGVDHLTPHNLTWKEISNIIELEEVKEVIETKTEEKDVEIKLDSVEENGYIPYEPKNEEDNKDKDIEKHNNTETIEKVGE